MPKAKSKAKPQVQMQTNDKIKKGQFVLDTFNENPVVSTTALWRNVNQKLSDMGSKETVSLSLVKQVLDKRFMDTKTENIFPWTEKNGETKPQPIEIALPNIEVPKPVSSMTEAPKQVFSTFDEPELITFEKMDDRHIVAQLDRIIRVSFTMCIQGIQDGGAPDEYMEIAKHLGLARKIIATIQSS